MLFLVLIIALFANCDRVPEVFKCEGTHYDCFKSMGEHFTTDLKFIFNNYEAFQDKLLPWYKANKAKFESYLNLINGSYPQYIDEVRGLADGSGIPFDYVLLLNLENEIEGFPVPELPEVLQCTDIHVNLEDRHCTGHNEDGGLVFHNTSYFVDLTIHDSTHGDEHFVAFCYMGQLPGLAFGYNKHGMTLSMNALIPETCREVGIPKFIVNRDALTATSFDDVILKTVGVTNRACGHSLNIGSIHEHRQMLIELAAYESATREIIGNYSHMNNYRLLTIPFVEDPSSTHRLARTFEMPAPEDPKDILNILGDTHDPELPLYRKYTMASALYDLDAKIIHIYTANPKESDPVLKMSLELD